MHWLVADRETSMTLQPGRGRMDMAVLNGTNETGLRVGRETYYVKTPPRKQEECQANAWIVSLASDD